MQLKVIKADGTLEEYLHTKVIGTINNALASVDESNVFAAEQFAEAITFYLYRHHDEPRIASERIHLMIQAILSATGYDHAARALTEHRLNRQLARRRTVVVRPASSDGDAIEEPWTKSVIVRDLIARQGLDYHVARAIASAVEEKALALGLSQVRITLVRELVAGETDALLRAGRQLQTVTP